MVELFRIRLHVFVTPFMRKNDVTSFYVMTEAILQWQLTSASERFPRAFKTVTLLFHIIPCFNIGYIGEVCKNNYLSHFIHYFVTFYTLFCHILFTILSHFIHDFVTFYSLFCHILFTILSRFINYFVTFYSLFCRILVTIVSHFIPYFVMFYSLL